MEMKYREDLKRIIKPEARGLTCTDSFLNRLTSEIDEPLQNMFNGYVHTHAGNLVLGGRGRLKILASLLRETQKGVV
jgi:hypothetical protein